jgi:hypothetical protein
MSYAKFAKTDTGNKVHMAIGNSGLIPCDRNERATRTLGDIPDAGHDELIAAIVDQQIRPSHLCARCFPARTRRAVIDTYRAAA